MVNSILSGASNFWFQFKNVEYSSGRNKTFLCYLVDKGNTADGLLRGYLEDEHTGSHAEEAFFTQCLPHYDPALKYTITWYVSSSPCTACAEKIAEVLKARKNIKLSIFAARLFEWEEAEIQAGLRALHAAGCKLRAMFKSQVVKKKYFCVFPSGSRLAIKRLRTPME
uniref:Apolipoprotein B mRNA editing enzyme, catalytic polypeptide-like 2a n=1 Tax=Lates calcarifer TaxID=8187 RepID=A0A4W6EDP6_LATCA